MLQLGKYQLVAEIARGGMGIVYLAVAHGPARFSKLLVVKELKPELVEDPTFLEMFLEEARLAARLNHPNIVQTYEIGNEGNHHYMVMDYLEGVTLARVLRKKSDAFTLGMQLRIMCEILQGLSYAHDLKDFDGSPLGIVHRDGTPQNVFITFDGQIKLVDFGIAKALDSTVETRTGVLKGKPAYMAPEQIAGDVDPRADIFSVGVMVWEAVVGRRMWHKKGDVEVLTNIIKGNIPSIREAKPDAPETLIRIVDRALAKNREERYPTASDFQADLEAYLVMSKQDVSTREVGKLVAELFASERATTKTTIEQHIASIAQGKPPPEKLPSLRPGAHDSLATPSGAAVGSLRLADPPSFTPASVRSVPTGTPAGTEMPSGAAEMLAKSAGGGKQRLILAGALAGAFVLVGGAFALRMLRSPAGPDPSTSLAKTMPEAAPVPQLHEVSLRVTPPSAAISVEGVAMLNPGKRSCIHGQRLMVHASAAHYVSTDRELACESDETIELALQPEPAGIAAAAAPATNPTPPVVLVAPPPPPGKRPPAVTAPPPPAVTHAAVDPAKSAVVPTARPGEVSPTGGTRPNRPIDTANPYGNP